MVELFGELWVGLYVHAAGEHHVDRGVEVGARGVQSAAAIVLDAAVIVGLRPVDELLHLVRIRGAFHWTGPSSPKQAERCSGIAIGGAVVLAEAAAHRRSRLPQRGSPSADTSGRHAAATAICAAIAACIRTRSSSQTQSRQSSIAALPIVRRLTRSRTLCARAGPGSFRVVASKVEAVHTPHGSEPHPQLRDHRAYRPRQVHPLRPAARAHRSPDRARDAGAGAGRDGPGARARHHHQGAHRAHDVQGAGRRDLPAQPDRHPRPRRLQLRGLALAGVVRGRAAGGRRLAGRGGADARQRLPSHQQRPRDHPRHQQDRPALGRYRTHSRDD